MANSNNVIRSVVKTFAVIDLIINGSIFAVFLLYLILVFVLIYVEHNLQYFTQKKENLQEFIFCASVGILSLLETALAGYLLRAAKQRNPLACKKWVVVNILLFVSTSAILLPQMYLRYGTLSAGDGIVLAGGGLYSLVEIIGVIYFLKSCKNLSNTPTI